MLFKDFEKLCVDHGADILDRQLLSFDGEEQSFMKVAPNLLTEIAFTELRPELKVVIATSNQGKLKEFETLLAPLNWQFYSYKI